ncbi:hypothetical protein AAHZ94_34940, partial [Streptomyces sp. HSW2009]
GQVITLNRVSGTTRRDLWPAGRGPSATVQVGNTDDWLIAIAAGRAVGVSTTATADLHTYPGVSYRPLVDAPPVPVLLAWTDPPSHPAVPDLVALAREVIGQPPPARPATAPPVAEPPAAAPPAAPIAGPSGGPTAEPLTGPPAEPSTE